MPNLTNITPQAVSDYKDQISQTASPATIKRKEIALNKFFNWAETEGHIPSNPLTPQKEPDENPYLIVQPHKSFKIKRRHIGYIGITTGLLIIIFMLLKNIKNAIPFVSTPAQVTTNTINVPNVNITNRNATPVASPSASNSANTAVYRSWNLYAGLKLTDKSGFPTVGTQTISFKVYNTQSGGSPLYQTEPLSVTTDSNGYSLISLDSVPNDLFFQNERLFLAPEIDSSESGQRIPISTANIAANLNGYFPSLEATELTIPVIDGTGSLVLASETPAIKAEAGNFLIEGQAVTLKSAEGTDGDIEINPDGSGIAHFLFEGNRGNFLNAQAPNLTNGSLYYGIVANNATGYDLIRLQNGSKPVTRFSVNALGDTFISGSETVMGNEIVKGSLTVNGISNSNNYSQSSGNFTISQKPGDFASIVKSGTALSDVLTITLDERGKPATSNTGYSTLVLNRFDGAVEAAALKVETGNAIFNGQLQLGRYTSTPSAIGEGSLVYNTTDDQVYVYTGSAWTALGTGSGVAFNNIQSGTNTSATMLVGTGASLGFTGSGTINASTLNGSSDASFLRSDTSDNFTSGTLTTDTGTTLDIQGNLVLDSDAGSTGQLITSAGSGTPTWSSIISLLTNGTDISITGTTNATINNTSTLDTVTGRGATTSNTITVGNLINSGLTINSPVFTDASNQLVSTGTVGANQGGTGFSSYTVGDILYADTTSTLARLNDVATGNVLISGGISTAPSWGKITLGTHTTGNYVSSITGTANQITASASTGDVTLSIPNDFRVPGTIQLNGITYTFPGTQSSNFVLATDGSGTLTWEDPSVISAGSNYWNLTNGLLFPKNSSTDTLFGGSATASAKFAFINTLSGTPTASISGSTSNVNAYLTGNGNLAVTNSSNLTLGGSTTGNVIADSPFIANSTITLPNSNTLTGQSGLVEFSGGISAGDDINTSTGNGYLINNVSVLNATTLGSSVVNSSLTSVGALSSGSIASGFGTIATANTITGTVINGTTGINTGAGAGTQRIDLSGNLTNIGTTQLNGITYTWPGSQNTNYILQTDGIGVLSWVDPSTIVASTLYWDQANGALSTKNNSVDLLIGANSTDSAKFAFKNVLTGTPTASIAGSTANVATFITGNGNLATTNMTNLTLGGSTTGNVVINSRGSNSLTANGANLTTTGSFTLPNSNTLTGLPNFAQFSNGISVGGGTTYYFSSAGDINSNGLTVNANTTLGDATSDTVNFTGRVNSSINPSTNNLYDLGSASLKWANIYATAFNQNGNTVCDGSDNCLVNGPWVQGSGILNPKNNSVDVLIGSNSTSSAKFAFTGVLSGTPTASVSGTYLTADGNIATTKMQHLTLGGSTTGQVDINNNLNLSTGNEFLINNASVLNATTLGSSVANSSLTSVGALASGSIASGFGSITTTNSITGGDLTANGNIILGDAITDTLTFTGRVAQDSDLIPITTTGTNDLGSASLPWDNLYAVALTQNGNAVCDVSGANCPAGAGYWGQTNGALYPNNDSVDLLIGSNSTASAKFAFKNVLTGVPTASIAGITANVATYLTGEGNLATTNMNHLTLGGSTTGRVNIDNNLNLTTGNALLINGANILNATTLGSSVVNSSLTSVGALSSGSIASGFGTIATSNTITGTTLNGTTGINTGAGAGTQRIDASGNITSADLTANGNIILGDAITDTLTFTGRVAQDSDLLPITTTGTNDLGSALLPWDNVYAVAFTQNGNTVCDSSGNCAGSTNFWQLNNKIISPANSTYDLAVGGTATGSAFQVFGIENTGGSIAKINSSVITTGNVIEATASAITSGNIIKLGTGGDDHAFSGNGILMDFDNSGGGNFTGNFLRLDNSGSTALTINSVGNITTTGDLALNGGDLTSSASTLNINAGGNVDIQDILNTDSITTDTGGVTIASGQSYTGLGAVTLSSGGSSGLTLDSASNTLTLASSDTLLTASGLANITSASTLTFSGDIGIAGGDITGANSASIDLGEANSGDLTLGPNTDVITNNATFIGLGSSAGRIVFTDAATDEIEIQTANVDFNTNIAINIGNAGTDFDTSGGLTLAGDFTVNGNSTLGNAITDTLTFTARVAQDSDLIPITTTGTNDLGSASLPWDNVYAVAFTQNGNTVCDSSGNCPGFTNYWAIASGALFPTNNSLDVLIGADATTSAKFAFKNVLTGVPTASIAGTTANVATYLTGEGNLATTNMNHLTLGGSTTGRVNIDNNLNLTTGNALLINGADTLNATTLGSSVVNSSLTSVGTLASGSIASGFGSITTTNTITGGDLIVNGNTTLGDAITDTLTFTGRVAQDSDLIPITATGTNDLGSASLEWDNVYATAFTQNGNTVCDSSGNCPGSTNLWQLNNKIVSPGNSTYDLAIGGTATGSAFQVFGIENTGGQIAKLNSTVITSGSVIEATSSAITTGNLLKLGSGGDGHAFSGNGILMDFDNSGGGNFTGNFLRLDNSGATQLTINSVGDIATLGDLAVNGDDITSDSDLTITPAGGQLILADTVTFNAGGKTNVGYNTFANSADSPASTAITTDNDLFIGGDTELKGGLYLTGRNIYNVVGGVSTGTIAFATDPALVDSFNVLGYGSWLIENNTNPGIAALMVNQTKAGDIFTASASGVTQFRIDTSGNVTAAGTTGITLSGADADLIFSGSGTHSISNSTAGTDLTIDAGTSGAIDIGSTSTGNVNLAGGSGATGCTIANSTGDLTCTGDGNFNGGDIITSASTASLFNTNATTLNIGGAATTLNLGATTGTTTINNDLTIGNAITDAITFTGRVAQNADLIPITATGTNDLGSASLEWDNVYATALTQNGNSVCDSSGNCLTSASYWQLNNKILSPGNSTYDLAIGGTATDSAFQVFGIEKAANATSRIQKINSTVITTGTLFEATSSAITTGNIMKLGTGGNGHAFSGIGLWMDFDNTGGGNFTGNFLQLDNSGTTRLTIDSTGNADFNNNIISNIGAAGTDFTASGGLTLAGAFTANGAINLGDGADLVTVDTGAWTFTNDTNFALTGGVNGLSFDGTTFSVDGANNRIGIGTAAPTVTLDVEGDIDVNTNIISNIGAAGTDFTASGGLTLAGAFTANGAINLGDAVGDLVAVNTGAWTFALDTNFALTGGVNGLSFDGTTFSVDGANNRIGIGTAAPTVTLDVEGDVDVNTNIISNIGAAGTDFTGTGGLTLAGAFTANGAIALGDGADTVTANTGAWTFSNDTDFVLTGGTNGLSIDGTTFSVDGANNRIGIGTAAPANVLTVVPGAVDDGIFVRESDNGANAVALTGNASRGTIQSFNAGVLNILFNSATGADSYISNGGDVGIGSSGPESRLQVTGGGLCVGSDANCNTDNDTEGVVYSSSTAMSVYDVAENYPTKDQTLTFEEIVELDPSNGVFVRRATTPYSSKLLGVISEKPAILLGGFNGEQFKEERQVAIALSGRVPVKMDPNSPAVNIGDILTASTLAGTAQKATQPGFSIGKALENWSPESGKDSVMVFVTSTYSNPEIHLTSNGELNIAKKNETEYRVSETSGNLITKIEGFAKLIAGNIKSGYVEAQDFVTEKMVAKVINTNLISPLADSTDVTIQIGSNATESGKLAIKNALKEEVASIDTQGNATFTGTVNAKNIDEIEGLLAQIQFDQSLLSQVEESATGSAVSTIENLTAKEIYFTNQITGLDFSISGNSINSLTNPLKIQSLALAPIELMAGLVKIDTNGNIEISGNLNVAGKITTPNAEVSTIKVENFTIASPVDASNSGVVASGNITTNATAGKGSIASGTSEIIITNNKITDYTLIYVTPTSDTKNNVLYVKSKEAGNVKIGFTNPVDIDVSFNWWIVQVE